MEPADIFRNNVNAIIDKKKLVQAHIAEAIGEKPQGFNGYLKGRINWGEAKRKKLAAYLKVEYHELYNQEFLSGAKTTIGLDEIAGATVERKGQIDPTQLKEVLDAVDTYLAKAGRSMDTDKKSRLVALLYDRFVGTDENIEQEKISHYLKLIA
jgi:hypothetical protein